MSLSRTALRLVALPAFMLAPASRAAHAQGSYEIEVYSTEIAPVKSLLLELWTWELRPVIDKSFGRWYVSVNPTVERTLEGPGVINGIEFSPSAKAEFDFTDRISGGAEYYAAYGKIGGFAPPQSRLKQVFGVVDLHVSPRWEVNAGTGAGMTPATSHLVGKLILGRRF